MVEIVVYLDPLQNGDHLSITNKNLTALACRLKELLNGNVTAVLTGTKKDEIYLREALAAGCSRAVLAQPLQGISDAYLAAALAQRAGAQVIVTGSRVLDGKTAYIGAQTAQLLGFAHADRISKIVSAAGRQIVAERMENGIQEIAAVTAPCLLTAGEKEQKIKTLSVDGILKAFEKEIDMVTQEEGEKLVCDFMDIGDTAVLNCLRIREEAETENHFSCEIMDCMPAEDRPPAMDYEEAVSRLADRLKERGLTE